MNPFNFFTNFFSEKFKILKEKFIDHPYALRAAIRPHRTIIKSNEESNRIIEAHVKYYGLMYWALLFGARKRIKYWFTFPFFKFRALLFNISLKFAPKVVLIPRYKLYLRRIFYRNHIYLRLKRKYKSFKKYLRKRRSKQIRNKNKLMKKNKIRFRPFRNMRIFRWRRRKLKKRKRAIRKRLRIRLRRYIWHKRRKVNRGILEVAFFKKPHIQFLPMVLAFFYIHLFSDYYSLIKDIDKTRESRLEPYRLLDDTNVEYDEETFHIMKANYYNSCREHQIIRKEISYFQILRKSLYGVRDEVMKYL